MATPLLEIQDLNVAFDTERGQIRPVRDVSLSVFPGQTVAVVGESGCGKSVTALSILRLIPEPPGKILGGEVRFEGRDLLRLSEKEMRGVRGKDIALPRHRPADRGELGQPAQPGARRWRVVLLVAGA